MSEWQQLKLGDLVTLNYGKALKAEHRKPGKVPVYSSAGLTGTHDTFLVNSEGIIVGRKGTVGKVYYSFGPFCCIDTAYYITPNPERYNFQFLYYMLQTLGLEELNEDSAVPGLNRETAYNQDIALPPLPEQNAIASVLSSLDDKIDLLHRQNKTLEKMAETLFRQWFIEDESINDVAINELIEFNPKRTLAKGTQATYLEMAGLSTQNFNATGYYIREFSSGTKFIQQDTLLARITPCLENGKSGYVTFLNENEVGWGSTEYIVMRPKAHLHPLMAYVLTRNQDFRDYAEGCMEGSSGRQRVNVDHLKEYKIGNPSHPVIQKFNDYLKSIESKLIYNSKQIQTLEKLRDTLLPKLMSGEVRVEYKRVDAA
ncbi:restriction endonuclease subunit S [Acinetobacter baumannii]|uniref:restriction endonuclease subunit S n=1 Tax=Acinetobacter baumannii TaxID=470 RepID=UPI0024DE9283|nr:restriction endonuclease subunit S [Acinetobacter baumannii]MDK2172032.1 restriction endonuclease subunit S [Acinetobacter baumannii]MDK2182675.1 restriction endonuclease subunit S [Acinetobacter baumannii]MDK2328690.1 restriction endonuclease subunit S [Acinetobacter baumannii]